MHPHPHPQLYQSRTHQTSKRVVHQPQILYSNQKLEHINCILDGSNCTGALFIGDTISALKQEYIQNKNIRAIVCLNTEAVNFLRASTLHFDLKYIESFDQVDYPILLHFQSTAQFINAHITMGNNVLVQCHGGVSRSVTIICAYLIKYHNMDANQALAFVKQKRQRAKPNQGFMKQLQNYSQLQYRSNKNNNQGKQQARQEGNIQQQTGSNPNPSMKDSRTSLQKSRRQTPKKAPVPPSPPTRSSTDLPAQTHYRTPTKSLREHSAIKPMGHFYMNPELIPSQYHNHHQKLPSFVPMQQSMPMQLGHFQGYYQYEQLGYGLPQVQRGFGVTGGSQTKNYYRKSEMMPVAPWTSINTELSHRPSFGRYP